MKPELKTAEQRTPTRRKFLLSATLGSAGAVAAVVSSGGGVQQVLEVASVPAEKKVKGYHETDHIRQYYETTRI
jgi:hypothetical protein